MESFADLRDTLMALLQLHQYKAIAVLIGVEEAGLPLPLPGDLAIVFMGTQVSAGKASPIPIVLVTAGSATTGASALYWIARLLGTRIVERYGRWLHLTAERQERVERWFARHGAAVIIVGRLIPGLRIAVAVAAGVARVRFSRFVIYTAISALIWGTIYTTIGWVIGERWEEDRESIEAFFDNPLVVLIVGATLGTIVTLWLLRKRGWRLGWRKAVLIERVDSGATASDPAENPPEGQG
jgi:membrane protein DedA with SNARE-associated domain